MNELAVWTLLIVAIGKIVADVFFYAAIFRILKLIKWGIYTLWISPDK